MQTTRRVGLFLSLLVGTALPAASEATATSSVTVEKLRGGIALFHLPQTPHTVMAVLTSPDGALMVDFENPDLERLRTSPAIASQIFTALESLDAMPPRFLVLTHWHPDHVGGSVELGARTTVVAHRNVRRRLATRQTPFWLPEGVGPMPEAGLPDIVVDRELTIHLGPYVVELWHFGPAHTDGDVVVYFPHARIAHVGDLFHGFASPASGVDMEGLARVYEELIDRLPADALLITGHGPVVGRDELVKTHAMLVDTLGWARGRFDAGASPEAIRNAAPPAPWDARWQGSRQQLEMWIGAIVRSLTSLSEPLEDPKSQLLALHQRALDAHLHSDAETLLDMHADEVIAADMGQGIARRTRAQQGEMFRPYLASTTFTRYEDRTPPVARVSADGTLGWVIADVRIEGTQTRDGSARPLAFRGVWIELYALSGGSWRLVGTVSDVEPLAP